MKTPQTQSQTAASCFEEPWNIKSPNCKFMCFSAVRWWGLFSSHTMENSQRMPETTSVISRVVAERRQA